ncbi:hypothetical protein CEUSTIGMA_g694.t1 [Chlamydomonas eustigma]|uniref:Ion transport domain-containing protein n=1 Tax=Chlamydomonas eustigma TaxID=1157962 RepID=A0A250WRS1_9CHLO|nr:hypothetical protein CEUSTIGMA_g694.t1 [Chlamydomonas eustigma]|eukprot:GAX73240.1 hypothetical protein CEUSTIGMA_g694.t1 [Chlamydomonas eustigma]
MAVYKGNNRGSGTLHGNKKDLRVYGLMAKYAYIWLQKVFPDGTKSSADSDMKCPVKSIYIHGDQGNDEIIRSGELQRLEPGAAVYEGFPSTFHSLHPAFPKDCWYQPGINKHWSNNLDNYMIISFSKPTRVFVLLPSLNQQPRWLRHEFSKLKDPNLAEVRLKVDWKIFLGGKMMYIMFGQYDKWKSQTLRVYRSNRVFNPGETLTIGGPGLAGLMDTSIPVAFHQEQYFTVGKYQALAMLPRALRSADLHDFNIWHQLLIKAVKRNRLNEARILIETDSTRPAEMRHLLHHDVSALPPSEQEGMFVDIPAHSRNLSMLCLLVHRCHCKLSYKALRVIVRYWEDVPKSCGNAEGLMLQYLLRHQNPLSVVSAILMAIRSEIHERYSKKSTSHLETSLEKFGKLQVHLLEQLQELMRGRGDNQGDRLMRLLSIIDPKPSNVEKNFHPQQLSALLEDQPLTKPGSNPKAGYKTVCLSYFRPLRVAFADNDASFMATTLVETFARLAWRGQEYVLETCKEGGDFLSMLNPSMLFLVLCALGFTSPNAKPIEWMSWSWHLHTWSSQAFFNSPRARWIMRLLANIAFVLIYMQVVGVYLVPNWFDVNASNGEKYVHDQTINVALFNVWIFGNVVETIQVAKLRFKANASKYLIQQPAQVLFLVVDVYMFIVGIIYVLGLNKILILDQLITLKLTMGWAAMGPILMARVLLVMIPMLNRLGPMLDTFGAMVGEILMFAVPWVLVTAGFVVSLEVVFNGLPIPQFENFWSTLLFLFQAFSDRTNYEALVPLEDVPFPNEEYYLTYNLYGILILVCYSIISTILMGNLLIAIITNRYRPEALQAQSVLNFAKSVDMHQFQVEHYLLSSPFNLVGLAMSPLPSSRRKKVHPFYFFRASMCFLDGFTPATPQHQYLPSGSSEIPHFLYLCTLVPLMTACTTVLYILSIPYCVLYFAFEGHKKIIKQLRAIIHSSLSFSGTRKDVDSLEKDSMKSSASLSTTSGTNLATSSISSSLNRSSVHGSNSNLSGGMVADEEVNGLGEELDTEGPSFTKMMSAIGSFFAALCIGFFFYVFVYGTLVLAFAFWAWMGAILWSLYNILGCYCWMLMSVFMKLCRRRSSKVRVTDLEIADSCKAFVLDAELDRQRQLEEQAKHLKEAYISHEDLLLCIGDVFGQQSMEIQVDTLASSGRVDAENLKELISAMRPEGMQHSSQVHRSKPSVGMALGIAAMAKSLAHKVKARNLASSMSSQIPNKAPRYGPPVDQQVTATGLETIRGTLPGAVLADHSDVTPLEGSAVHELDQEHDTEHLAGASYSHLPHHLPPLENNVNSSETSGAPGASLQLQIDSLHKSVTVQASRLEEIQASLQAILRHVAPPNPVQGSCSVISLQAMGKSDLSSGLASPEAYSIGAPTGVLHSASPGSRSTAVLPVMADDPNNNVTPLPATVGGGGHALFSVALTAMSQSKPSEEGQE